MDVPTDESIEFILDLSDPEMDIEFDGSVLENEVKLVFDSVVLRTSREKFEKLNFRKGHTVDTCENCHFRRASQVKYLM